MRLQKVLAVATLLFGMVAALTGMALIAAYFTQAVVARWGEPDQSLLFWYLPFLFLGLFGLAAGLAAGTWGIHRLRRIVKPRRPGLGVPGDCGVGWKQ